MAPTTASSFQFAVVHHSAGVNGYSAAQVPALLRVDPGVPHGRERLERHRLQLRGRRVRAHLGGPRRRHRPGDRRRARPGVQHRFDGCRGSGQLRVGGADGRVGQRRGRAAGVEVRRPPGRPPHGGDLPDEHGQPEVPARQHGPDESDRRPSRRRVDRVPGALPVRAARRHPQSCRRRVPGLRCDGHPDGRQLRGERGRRRVRAATRSAQRPSDRGRWRRVHRGAPVRDHRDRGVHAVRRRLRSQRLRRHLLVCAGRRRRVPVAQSGRRHVPVGADPAAGSGFVPFPGDFDGDGDDDIFWYSPNSGRDFIWLATSGGAFRSMVTNSAGAGFRPVPGDYDGDGDDDIVWYTHRTPGGTWSGAAAATGCSSAGDGARGEPFVPHDGRRLRPRRRRRHPVVLGPGDAGDYLGDHPSAHVVGHPRGGRSSRPVSADSDADGGGDVYWYTSPGQDWMWWYAGRAFGRSAAANLDVP